MCGNLQFNLSYMAKATSRKIEIVSITYRSNGKKFTAKVTPRPAEKKNVLGFTQCTPGDTKCEDGIVYICWNIGGGQSDWLTSNEPC
jgi:hypothetical protein